MATSSLSHLDIRSDEYRVAQRLKAWDAEASSVDWRTRLRRFATEKCGIQDVDDMLRRAHKRQRHAERRGSAAA